MREGAGNSTTVFDLGEIAGSNAKRERSGSVMIAGFCVFFAAVGIYFLVVSVALSKGALSIAVSVFPLALGVGLLIPWVLSCRQTVEVRVTDSGVVWKPAWGANTSTDWSNPRLKLNLVDWRSNRIRTDLPENARISAIGSGFFLKRITPECLDAIVRSAKGAGVTIRDVLLQGGTKAERRLITLGPSS